MKLQIEYLPKEQLKPYMHNAKLHPAEQVEQIKKSIEEFGFNDPIAVWGDDEIVEGHGRLLAVMEMPDITEVPVIRLDHLNDEEKRAYALVHNKLTMNSDFDLDLLAEELDAIDLDMSDFGFDFQTLDEITESNEHQINLSESWEVIIECNSEEEQQNLYNRMMEEGWKCRLSTL